jgi:hypothetical protein
MGLRVSGFRSRVLDLGFRGEVYCMDLGFRV